MIVQFQPSFRPALPKVHGAKDYRQFRDTLIEMDHILAATGLEDRLINERISALGHVNSSAKRQQFLWRSTRLALRYSILGALTQEPFRVLSRQVADSLIFQWFTYTSFVDGVRPVSKSSAERFEKYFTPEQIGELVHALNKAVSDKQTAQELLYAETELRFDRIFADTSCAQANIHFPVDWVLMLSKIVDSKLVRPSIARIKSNYGAIVSYGTDRGFDSPDASQSLEVENIINSICPRSVAKFNEKLQDHGFRDDQQRRAATEGRIGIFKNNYLGRPMRSKGFVHRHTHVAWCVLAHNLWKLASMAVANKEQIEERRKAA